MASVIGRAILAMQAGASGGALAAELEREATFDFAIHQARACWRSRDRPTS